MVKQVLRSAEKFSEPFPLSPLPLYPSANYSSSKMLGPQAPYRFYSGGVLWSEVSKRGWREDVGDKQTPKNTLIPLSMLFSPKAWVSPRKAPFPRFRFSTHAFFVKAALFWPSIAFVTTKKAWVEWTRRKKHWKRKSTERGIREVQRVKLWVRQDNPSPNSGL